MAKNWFLKDRISDSKFKEVCISASSMAEAASTLGIHFNSFKKRALEPGCYKPNKAGIGIRKKAPKIPILDIVGKTCFLPISRIS